MGLFVLICVIDVDRTVYTIFCQLQSLVVISTHADRQSVDISVNVCLFVILSFCTLTDFSAGDKAVPAASNFARWFMGVLAWNLPFWGTLLPQKPKIRLIGARRQVYCRLTPVPFLRRPRVSGGVIACSTVGVRFPDFLQY